MRYQEMSEFSKVLCGLVIGLGVGCTLFGLSLGSWTGVASGMLLAGISLGALLKGSRRQDFHPGTPRSVKNDEPVKIIFQDRREKTLDDQAFDLAMKNVEQLSTQIQQLRQRRSEKDFPPLSFKAASMLEDDLDWSRKDG
jgi:hypothetical protein